MDEISLLKKACEETNQAKVAKKIGYSTTVVSLVLKGKYTGDMDKIKHTIRTRLGNSSVNCPILGEIENDRCLKEQSKPFSSASSHSVRMFKACMNCQYNTKRSK